MLAGTLCREPTNTSVGWAGINIGWNPARRLCCGWEVPEEDPILDAGSGPRPVSLSLVIGKFLDGIECENQQKGTRDCDGFQKQLARCGMLW